MSMTAWKQVGGRVCVCACAVKGHLRHIMLIVRLACLLPSRVAGYLSGVFELGGLVGSLAIGRVGDRYAIHLKLLHRLPEV